MPVWSATVARGDDGALTVGGCDVRALAAEHGTPLYVVDEADFRARAAAFASTSPPRLGVTARSATCSTRPRRC